MARAFGSGPKGRRFKSALPDHFMKKQLHVYYSGRVQGVGFRFTAESLALELNVIGWVKNLRDGRVEITAEAEEENLERFLVKIKESFSRYINNVDIERSDAGGKFKEFTVEF